MGVMSVGQMPINGIAYALLILVLSLTVKKIKTNHHGVLTMCQALLSAFSMNHYI